MCVALRFTAIIITILCVICSLMFPYAGVKSVVIMENRERSSSPDHSCVSLKSDRSMGPPPKFSDDPVTSDPR